MKKKLVSIIIALALLLTFAPASLAETGVPASPESAANALYKLGLFKGTGSNADGTPIFELDRSLTRQESITMLIRLLGDEQTALLENRTSPFTDVEDWAKPYVGYAYAKGYTNGTGTDTFGGNDEVTATEYLTFVLRALGYSSGKDFKWDAAWKLSDAIGMTNGEYNETSTFLRGDAALISYNALAQTTKDGLKTLLKKLVSDFAVTTLAVDSAGLSDLLGDKALSAGEVYFKSREAVFAITSYDLDKNVIASGSGFFIDGNGTAVTNARIIKDAASAKIVTFDGTQYDVLGIYDFSDASDLAVIKVNGSGFMSLTIGSSEMNQGDAVYGMSFRSDGNCVISSGTVTDPAQELNGVSYIRNSIQFASGETGGPLLDIYGRVIGVFSDTNGPGIASPSNSLTGLSKANLSYFPVQTGYSGFAFAPDFGAYFGVAYDPALSAVKNGYAIYIYNKESVNAAVPDASGEYGKLLTSWGYSYKGEFTGTDTNGFAYTKDGHFVFVGTTAINGADYFEVIAI